MGGATTLDEAVEFSVEIGPVARLLADVDAAIRPRVVQSVREALTPYTSAKGVSVPSAVWIVQAQRKE